MIQYKCAETKKELLQILELQKVNLPKVLNAEEQLREGFVTLKHDLELLSRMNDAFPHTIALENGRVVGYTLVMLPLFKDQFPILNPMFERIENLVFRGQPLARQSYFVMGQVCVAKAFRGTGVFAGCYQHMKKVMQEDFDLNITVIAKRNTRSMRAHEKVGFRIIHEYTSNEEEWAIVVWDWS